MSRHDIEKLIVNHQRRLQKLKEQQAIHGLDTPPDILIDIENTEEAIEELQIQLEALEDSVINDESSTEDINPKQRVKIYLHGNFSSLSADRKAAAIDAFAALMKISPQAIDVYSISEGSVVFNLGIPPNAVERLRSRLQSNSAQLRVLKVERVIIERSPGEIEEWVTKRGKFYLVTSVHPTIPSDINGNSQGDSTPIGFIQTNVRVAHLIRSTGILMTAFLANKFIAIGRQIVIARAFGTGGDYDAFVAAFRLPDILFMLISGGALATAFIPILSERLTLRPTSDPDGWRLTSATLNTVILIISAAAALVAIVALPLVQRLIAPGFSPETQLLTANLMRLALISTIIFSVSGLVGGVLHVHQHFLLPALAPIIYNLGIIAGAIFLAPTFGVYGLMWGAIAGAAGHLLIQVPGLIRYKMSYQPRLGWRDSGLHQVAKLMGPRILTLGVIQVNFLVIFNLASRLGEGSVSALDYGWDLMQMPQTIIGSAIGIVLFPTMSALAAQGDIANLRRTTTQALRIILALSIPAMVGLITLGRPVIQLMFERGEFGPDSTAAVYQSLQFWALALVGHSALEVVNRLFYAQKDTTTPLLGALVGMIVNLGLAMALYQVLNAGGLALSNGVAVTVEVLILLAIARRRMVGVEVGPLLSTLARTLLAAGAMGTVMLIFSTFWPTLPPLFMALGGGVLGLMVYIVAGLLLGIEEIRMVSRLVGR